MRVNKISKHKERKGQSLVEDISTKRTKLIKKLTANPLILDVVTSHATQMGNVLQVAQNVKNVTRSSTLLTFVKEVKVFFKNNKVKPMNSPNPKNVKANSVTVGGISFASPCPPSP